MAILIAIIIAYFFVSIVRYHKRYIKLQKERLDAEIQMQENERKRIANDLHDSIGPMLSAVKININCVTAHTIEDELIIKKSSGYIDDIINNLRRISHNLLPNTLERQGVIEALREFIDNLPNKTSPYFTLDAPDKIRIATEKGVHIFRILQEIIHNTIKHSNSMTMQITISEENGILLIVTKDNGVGFNMDNKTKESNGLGLKSIRSRVELLNGKITLKSELQKGTIYILEIPV